MGGRTDRAEDEKTERRRAKGESAGNLGGGHSVQSERNRDVVDRRKRKGWMWESRVRSYRNLDGSGACFPLIGLNSIWNPPPAPLSPSPPDQEKSGFLPPPAPSLRFFFFSFTGEPLSSPSGSSVEMGTIFSAGLRFAAGLEGKGSAARVGGTMADLSFLGLEICSKEKLNAERGKVRRRRYK